MRSLFFLLMLVNVALLMWEYQKITRNLAFEPVKSQWADHRQNIILSLERKTGEQVGDVVLSGERNQPWQEKTSLAAPDAELGSSREDDRRFCYEAGPLVDSKRIGQWQRVLTVLGAEVKQFNREERVVKDYLVFYPAADSPEESQVILEKLKTAGYGDAWLLKEEGRQGDIALGVFNQEAAALAMKEQMEGKGFMVAVRPRERAQNQIFALISGSSRIQAKVESSVAGSTVLAAKHASYCSEADYR